MKKIYIAGLVGTSILLSGCGSSSGTSTNAGVTTPAVTNTIQVVRGPILGAIVKDRLGKVARSVGEGNYTFTGTISYPISATGGVIDTDRNGLVSVGDVKNDMNLTASTGNVITVVTTYEADPTTKDMLQKVANSLNISASDFNTKTPRDSKEIEAISNVLYKYAQDNNISKTSVGKIETDIGTTYDTYKQNTSHNSQTVEQELIKTLVAENKLTELKAGDIANEVKTLNDNYTTEYSTSNSKYEIANGDSNYNEGGENSTSHYEGQSCAKCHSSGENQFTSGGTIYTTLHDGSKTKTAINYSLRLVLQNTGTIIRYGIGRGVGNAYSTFNKGTVNSYTAEVLDPSGKVVNKSYANSHNLSRLDCNSCHTSAGATIGGIKAPGRIVTFDLSGTSSTKVTNAVSAVASATTTTTTAATTTTTTATTPATTTAATTPATTTTATTTTVGKSFAKDVMPILNKCKVCHNTNSFRVFKVSTTSATYANIQNLIDKNVASNSYLLQKGSNQLSHTGGNAIGTTNYNTLKAWITEGAKNN